MDSTKVNEAQHFTFINKHQVDCGTKRNAVHMKALAIVIIAATAIWGGLSITDGLPSACPQQQGCGRVHEAEVIDLRRWDLLLLIHWWQKHCY